MSTEVVFSELTSCCPACHSPQFRVLKGEIGLFSASDPNPQRHTVLIYTTVLACAQCGTAQFVITNNERHILRAG